MDFRHMSRKLEDAFLVFAGLQAQQLKDRADEQLRLHECTLQHQHHSFQHDTKDRYDAKESQQEAKDRYNAKVSYFKLPT